MKVDLKKLSSLDRAIAGGAGVVFIAGFLPWWGYSGPLSLYSASVNGWSAGFTGWAGTLLLTLAGVYLVLRRSGASLPSIPVGPSVLVAGVAGLGLLLVVVRWLTLPRVHAGAAGSIGAKYGIWLAIIAGIVEVARCHRGNARLRRTASVAAGAADLMEGVCAAPVRVFRPLMGRAKCRASSCRWADIRF